MVVSVSISLDVSTQREDRDPHAALVPPAPRYSPLGEAVLEHLSVLRHESQAAAVAPPLRVCEAGGGREGHSDLGDGLGGRGGEDVDA